MPRILRFDPPARGDSRRWVIGVVVACHGARLQAALLTSTGTGLAARAEIAGARTVPGGDLAPLVAQLASAPVSATAALAELRPRMAAAQAALIDELLAECGVPPGRVLAVAVHDPGFWQGGKPGPGSYFPISDPVRLAELTGLNVIDGFTERDLASGGQGGPVEAVAQWILLHAHDEDRVLLDLGRTLRMAYLPADKDPCAAARILAFDVGPGMRLLDLFTQRLTAGQQRFDPGGRLAVQGHRISELVDHWLAAPYFERPLPRWNPQGVRAERFLAEALQAAVERGWSVRDLLCSATHFLAETVVATFQRRLPQDAGPRRIVLTGGGQHNGMLLREIACRLPGVGMAAVGELGLESDAVDAAAVAVLGTMLLDQVPASLPAVTGTDVPRVLGRITPGSAPNWQRLLKTLTGAESVVRPLRSAI